MKRAPQERPLDSKFSLPADELCRAIWEQSADSIFLADNNGRILDANPAAIALLDYSHTELLQLTLADVLPAPAKNDAVSPGDLQAVAELAAESWLLGKNGRRLPVALRVSKVGEKNQLIMAHDLRQHKKLDKKAGESEAKFRYYIEHAPLGILVADREGRFVEANPSICRMLGYTEIELLHMSIPETIAPKFLPEAAQHFQNVVEKGVSRDRIMVRRRDGSEFWTFIDAVRLTDDRFMAFIQDITAQVHLENELRRNSDMLEKSLNGFGLVSAQGNFIYANQANIKMWGYDSLDEMVGMHVSNLNADPANAAQIFGALENNNEVTVEFLAKRKDGSTFDVLMSILKMVDENGVVTFAGTSLDISERKKAEAALRQSQERFAKAYMASPAALAITHIADGRIIDINESYLCLYGYNREELVGRRTTERNMFAPEERAKFLQELAQSGCVTNFETITKIKSGELRHILLTAVKIELNGEACLLTHINDITARKQAEQALRESEERFARAFAANPAVLSITYIDDGKFVDANESFQRLFGYSRDELIGANITDIHLFPRQERAKFLKELREKGHVRDFATILYNKSGEARHVLLSSGKIVLNGQSFLLTHTNDITDRKLAEQALRESEERFAKAFINSPAVLSIASIEDGRLIDVNESFLRLTGYNREELIGFTAVEKNMFLHADRAEYVQELRSYGRVSDFEITSQAKDKTLRTLLLSAEVITLNGEECLLTHVNDITKRKQAEKALRDSEARYHSALENMLEGCQILSFDWRYLYLNASVIRHSRHTKEELLGHTVMECYPGIENTELFSILSRCMRERSSQLFEYKFYYSDGDFAWFIFSVQPVPEGLFILTIDITERKRIEAEMHELHDTLARAEAVAGVGSWKLDLGTQKLTGSSQFMRTFGLDPETFDGDIGAAIYGRIHPDDLAKADKILSGMGESASISLECRVTLPSGMQRVVFAQGKLVWHTDGKPAAMIGYVQDITERRQAEEARAKLESQLRQAQKMESIGRLAGGIAHDFNNLLVPITGYVELGMMQTTPDSKLYAQLVEARKAAERAGDLTRQILAFSRQQVLEMQVLDLNEVVDDFRKMTQRLIGEDIDLQVILAPSLFQIKADKGQIEQVLLNLAVNARDAMPAGGKLTIETANFYLDDNLAEKYMQEQAPGHYVLLTVSDTGHGMDAEVQQKIFEPFFTTKERGKGTGLGLSTVFGIVKQHKGNIWVYSEPGKGTTFKILLPRTKDSTGPVPETVVESHAMVGSETVLVVEDDEMVRSMVCEILDSYGYQVLEATSPIEGLQFVADYREKLHLLLTDVIMPEMNGQELYEKAAAIHPDIKVMFMSGYTDNMAVRNGLLRPDAVLLQKPFAVYDLVRKVRQLLS